MPATTCTARSSVKDTSLAMRRPGKSVSARTLLRTEETRMSQQIASAGWRVLSRESTTYTLRTLLAINENHADRRRRCRSGCAHIDERMLSAGNKRLRNCVSTRYGQAPLATFTPAVTQALSCITTAIPGKQCIAATPVTPCWPSKDSDHTISLRLGTTVTHCVTTA